MKYLLVAAIEGELRPLRERLSGNPAVMYADVGVGLVESAVRMGEILAGHSPREQLAVIFLGSCGTRDAEVDLLSLVIANTALLFDEAVSREQAYFPEPLDRELPADAALVKHFESSLGSGVRVEAIASPLAISSSETEQRDLFFENLELFSVASACARFQTPWVAVSVVTNYVGPDAHNQWRENYRAAAEITAEAVLKFFEKH